MVAAQRRVRRPDCAQGMNGADRVSRRQYTGNNPTNATDPSGLQSKVQVIGKVEVKSGEFEWQIEAADPLGVTVDAKFWFRPRRDGLKADAISFIQVVHERTLGDDPYYPGKESEEDYYKLFSTNPRKANMVDHKLGENDPYFGARWNGKNWDDEDGTGQLGGKKTGRTATLIDHISARRDGRQGKVLYIQFETAAFGIDSQEVLAVLKWGIKIPADKKSPIVLFGKEDYGGKQFSLTASEEFKELVNKANAVKYKGKTVMQHPVTAPNRATLNLGGTSALPGK